MIDEEELITTVAEATGNPDRGVAGRAVEGTLTAFAAQLDRIEVEALAAELPARLAAAVRGAEIAPPPWLEEPYASLAEREGVPRGLAMEYAHVIGRALAERLGPDVVQLLQRRLPSPWREMLHHRGITPPPRPPHHAPVAGEGHTLASGKVGSRHPVAEFGRDRAQSDSIARAANPHATEKLSSGAAEGEPVATGHPRTRKISDADG